MSYNNKRGVGSRWKPRLGDRTIGQSKLGWGGQSRKPGPRARGGTSVVMVPVTNAKTIIFPYSELTYKFNTRYYKPEHSDNKMSFEEAASFLNHVDNLVAPGRVEWGKGLLQGAGVLLFIAVMAFLISVPVTLVALDLTFPTPIVVTAIIAGCCLFLLVATHCYVGSKRGRIMDECITNIKAFIDQHADSFRGRNLTWVIPEHFPWWIELWKGEVLTGPKGPDNVAVMVYNKPSGPKVTEVPQQQYAEQNQHDQEYSQSHFAGTQSSVRTSNQQAGGFSMQSNQGGGFTMQSQGGGFSAQPRQGGGGGFSMSNGRTHPL